MAKVRVGINGFGRIGRNLFRAAYEAGAELEFVAVNDVFDAAALGHLLKFDSTYGRFPGEVEVGDGSITVDGAEIKVLGERDPGEPAVVGPRGRRRDRVDRAVHQARGRRQAPRGRGQEGDHLGAGDRPGHDRRARGQLRDAYDPDEHHIISNASCTTNCLAPVAKVLHERFGIERGLMTTIHAYTQDQRLQDSPHKDPRRARAAGVNLIPTSTGAAKAVGLVLPELTASSTGSRSAPR